MKRTRSSAEPSNSKTAGRAPALITSGRLSNDEDAVSMGKRGGSYGSVTFHLLDDDQRVVMKRPKLAGDNDHQQQNDRSIINEVAVHLGVGPSPNIAQLRGVLFDPQHGMTSAIVIDRWDDDLHRFIKAFHDDVPHLRKMRNSVGSSGYFFAALQILKDVAAGLLDIHAAGYVHGDLSAANVLWRQTPYFFQGAVGDLGRAVTAASDSPHDLPVFYWPPLSQHELTMTPKMDIYSFGILIYCVALGKTFLSREPLTKLRTEGTSAVFQNSREVSPGSKRAFMDIAWKCVAPRPSNRPSTRELRAMLLQLEER